MSSGFQIDGLDAFRAELRNLPENLAQEGGDLIIERTNIAAQRIFDGYPNDSGHLKGGVKFKTERSRFGALGTVWNSAFIAFIFEEGSQARHVRGTLPGRVANFGLSRGAMPPGHVFVPIMMEERRKVNAGLKTIIQAQGLETEGDLE